jgi:hypothetical protein
MASQDDFLTTLKNVATAVNSLANTWLLVNGKTNSTEISSSTSVTSGVSRVATVSVIVAGSTTGSIYDATTAASGSRVFTIPNTVGVTVLNMPMKSGAFTVVPGTGQIVTISYS